MLPKSFLPLFLYLFINTTQAQPSLIASFTSFPNTIIKRGDYLAFSFKIKNTGNADAQKSHVSVYLSPSQSLVGAVRLSEISTELLLNNSETQNIDYVYPIPYNLQGNYYLILYPDSRREVLGNASNFLYVPTNTISITSTGSQQNLPYPVILIHGLNGNDTTWYPFLRDVGSAFGYSYGGSLNFCLNQDGDNSTGTLPYDFKDWTDTSLLNVADFYTANFDVNPAGFKYSHITESNQASVVKQGLAIREAVKHILDKTKRDKVILIGHSMGGLAAREYLQSFSWQEDGQHHIAKLHTTGTPHGGSNSTAFGTGAAHVDEKSEAVRDLRRSYAISQSNGVYLFGGIESNSVMWNNIIYNYNNIDVNCNGITGENIIGINWKNIPNDLTYSCTIGYDNYGVLCSNCDGVVGTTEANLKNYYNTLPVDTFICYATGSIDNPLHIDLPKRTDFIVKGIDEPYTYEQGYNVEFDKLYFGNFSTQSLTAPYSTDYDDFKFSVPSNQFMNIKLYNVQLNNCRIDILDYSLNIIYTTYTNGKGYLDVNFPISAGNYYFEISGISENSSWLFPYAFKLELTGSGSCSDGYVSFNSIVTGNTYQWQVDKGNGYSNVINDTIYTGSNTKMLELKLPPTNWYGYKYRCLVNGNVLSTENVLRFTNTWSGNENSAWENPSNWKCGIVPDTNTDAFIPSIATHYPEVNSNQYCRSLSVSPSASVSVKPMVNLFITGK